MISRVERVISQLRELIDELEEIKGNLEEKKDVKREIEKEFIMESLMMNHMEGEIRLFRKLYEREDGEYDIRYKNNKIEHGGKEEDVISRIESLYYGVNTIENFRNPEIVLRNQEYIYKISDKKNKDSFEKRIKNMMRKK